MQKSLKEVLLSRARTYLFRQWCITPSQMRQGGGVGQSIQHLLDEMIGYQ